MRMIVAFSKGREIRFIGHLDLMRTFQRALRRSGLPLRFSNGFNPHILLGFAVPLSVGVVGLEEWMDVPLAEDVSEAEFREKMNATLPDCIRIAKCIPVDEKLPALMSLVAGAEYHIVAEAAALPQDTPSRYEAFAAQAEIVTLRKTKSGEKMCNIKRFVEDTSIAREGESYVIRLKIRSDTDGMLKPLLWFSAFTAAIGVQDVPAIAYRDAILAKNDKGELIPMEGVLR